MQVASLAKRIALATIVATAAAFFSTSANAQLGTREQDTNAPLAPPALAAPTIEPFATYQDAAHVANGASLRDSGAATIRLRGMPSDAKVIKAWLYWDFTSLTSPTNAQSHILFGREGTFINFPTIPLTGTLIGSGGDPCWFGNQNFAFRSDVSKFVNGNGDYIVTLFRGASSSTDGSNPWGPTAPTTGPLAEGTSLVVIYSSSAEPTGTVLVYDVGLAGTLIPSVFSYGLAAVPAPGKGSSIFTEIGADGQIGSGVSASTSTSSETTALNATLIAGPGSPVNDGDWNGTDGVPLNQLWDTHSHDVSGLLLTGLNNVTITSSADCLVTIANVLTVR